MNLLAVEKPARYMGGEMGSILKDAADLRFALAFPDVYEVGMSHLGLRILYHILNGVAGVAAERVFAPWPDMEKQLQASIGRKRRSLRRPASCPTIVAWFGGTRRSCRRLGCRGSRIVGSLPGPGRLAPSRQF